MSAHPFDYLQRTLHDCAAKLAGIDHRFVLTPDGLEIHVAQGGLANRMDVSWDDLKERPELVPLRAGMAAGELVRMREHRTRWREDLAAGPAQATPH